MSSHTAIQYIEIYGPCRTQMEIEVEISYTFQPGERETGPSYACGGTPAVPAYVEDLDFKAYELVYENGDGRGPAKRGQQLDLPVWLAGFIEASIDEDALLVEASEYEDA